MIRLALKRRSAPLDNPTALTDLQSEKDLLEREAAAIRQSLHELRQAGREHTLAAHLWQLAFARQHEQLVIVAGKIGDLDKRILALVEGKEKSDPESASGVGRRSARRTIY